MFLWGRRSPLTQAAGSRSGCWMEGAEADLQLTLSHTLRYELDTLVHLILTALFLLHYGQCKAMRLVQCYPVAGPRSESKP